MASALLIDMVETAYQTSTTHPEWLHQLTSCAGRILGEEHSVVGYTLGFPGPDEGVEVAHVHVVGEHTWLAGVKDFLNAVPPEMVDHVLPKGIVNMTLSMFAEPQPDRTTEDWLDAHMREHGYQDVWSTLALNPMGQGIVFSSPLREPTTLSPAAQQTWLKMAVHIAAASRLRWNLSIPPDKAQPFDTAEAILEPDGKPVHLTSTTTSTTAQERLRRATRLMDKARGSLRRTAPLEALDLWEGLVAGHWSLVEHIDTDGRRFILAKKNAPHVVDPRQLTLRERQVVNFVVQGHHNKLIAYELGLGTSTVGHHLNKALRKLGFQSRAELITFFQQLASMPSRPAS